MVLGRSLKRHEDRPLPTGQGRFAADIAFADQLHMRVVRSPVAFGRLVGIEVDDAQAMAGVAAVWTGADVAGLPPIDVLITEDAPSPLNLLGVKAVGEGGINAVGAAIASAIDAALVRPGAVDRLPVSAERLHRLALAAR